MRPILHCEIILQLRSLCKNVRSIKEGESSKERDSSKAGDSSND